MTFSENIKKYRTAAGLTQEEVAEKVGISGQAVSKWETSDTFPDPTLLPSLADALGVSIDMLFGHEAREVKTVAPEIFNYIKHGDKAKSEDRRMYDTIASAYKSWDRNEYRSDIWDKPFQNTKMCRQELFTDHAAGMMFDHPEFAFATVVFEPPEGFESLFTEEAITYLTPLGDTDIVKCLIELLKRSSRSAYELTILLREAGVDMTKEGEIRDKLKNLTRLISVNDVEINKKSHTIVELRPNYTPYLLNIFAAAYAASSPDDIITGGINKTHRKAPIIK